MNSMKFIGRYMALAATLAGLTASANAFQVPNAEFQSALTGSGLAKVRFNH